MVILDRKSDRGTEKRRRNPKQRVAPTEIPFRVTTCAPHGRCRVIVLQGAEIWGFEISNAVDEGTSNHGPEA